MSESCEVILEKEKQERSVWAASAIHGEEVSLNLVQHGASVVSTEARRRSILTPSALWFMFSEYD